MNDFVPRTEPVASVARVTERSYAVPPATGSSAAKANTDAEAQLDSRLTEPSAGRANYARLRADIANVLADIKPPRSNTSDANEALMALMPQPVIVLPMPPADQRMVEFVAQVAQSLATRTVQARAAQANVTPLVLETAAS